MRNPYIVVLRLVRFARAVNREIKRHIPFWGSEALEAIEYLNFFKLAITLAAMLLVPAHYFKNFASTAAGKSELFMSPLKILTSFASASILVLGWFGFNFESYTIILITIIAGLTAPVWTYLFLGLFWYVRKFLRFFARLGGSFQQLLDFIFDPFWFETETTILWSVETFRKLNYGAYFQALVIFAIYVFVTFPIAIFPFYLSGMIIAKMDKLGFDFTGLLTGLVSTSGLYASALIVSWVYVRPIIFLYKETLKVPTEAAFRTDVYDLSLLAEKLWNGDVSVFDKDHAKTRLALQFADLLHRWCRSEIKAKRDYPNIYDEMLRDRASGTLEAVLAICAYLPDNETYLRTCANTVGDAKSLAELRPARARAGTRC